MVTSYGATTHSYILMGAQTFDTIVHDTGAAEHIFHKGALHTCSHATM